MSEASVMEDEYDFDAIAEEVAAKRGQVVVFPKPNQLQIDIDDIDQLNEFERRLGFLFGWFPEGTKIDRNPSKSPDHLHITITFPQDKVFSEWERLAMQSALNSDPIREYLNVARLLAGVQNPTRLFQSP